MIFVLLGFAGFFHSYFLGSFLWYNRKEDPGLRTRVFVLLFWVFFCRFFFSKHFFSIEINDGFFGSFVGSFVSRVRRLRGRGLSGPHVPGVVQVRADAGRRTGEAHHGEPQETRVRSSVTTFFFLPITTNKILVLFDSRVGTPVRSIGTLKFFPLQIRGRFFVRLDQLDDFHLERNGEIHQRVPLIN